MPSASPSSTANRSIVLRPPVPRGEPVRLARRVRVRLFGLAGFLVVFGGLGAAVMVVSDEPVVVALGLTTMAILALGCIGLADVVFRRRDGRIEVAPVRGGLELPPTAVMRWSGPVGAALALLFAGTFIVAGLTGVELGTRRYSSPAVGIVLGVVFLGAILHSPPSPARVPRVVLTPHGIGRRRGDRTRVVGWDEVRRPVLVTDPGVRVYVWRRDATESLLADPMRPDEDVRVLLPIAMCGSDPNLVLALIEHYRTHPEDRAELAGPEVIDRLRRGDFAAWQGRGVVT